MYRKNLVNRIQSLENGLPPQNMKPFIVDIIRHRDQVDYPELFKVDREENAPGKGSITQVVIRHFKHK